MIIILYGCSNEENEASNSLFSVPSSYAGEWITTPFSIGNNQTESLFEFTFSENNIIETNNQDDYTLNYMRDFPEEDFLISQSRNENVYEISIESRDGSNITETLGSRINRSFGLTVDREGREVIILNWIGVSGEFLIRKE
ncbi:hypothetical protein [Croceivirga thetidis]|uniref:Lipocalin-like domain-containing protein n=1 Tax=Croceivirga thetidis TaxID=2721623 RepID=A0ABX1GP55_9FLAO|nr:hypothetical protein [Croceivirga thetidis]NKI30850.1 hypothetical protein [Croceivirga thetidis]